MRKLFLIVVLSIMFCGITFNPSNAQEVGEKMPNLEGYVITDSGTWQNPDLTIQGTRAYMAKQGENDKYFVVHNECDGVTAELPFGVYDIEMEILYLDNAPTDGIIDAVVPSPRNYIYEDAPICE